MPVFRISRIWRTRPARVLLAAGALASLASCDAPNPLGPESAPLPRRSEGAIGSVSTASLPIPSGPLDNTFGGIGAVDWRPITSPSAEETYVRVRVTSGVEVVPNPEYARLFCPGGPGCDMELAGTYSGEGMPHPNTGALRVSIRRAGGAGGWFPLSNGTTQKIRLAPGEWLEASRTAMAGAAVIWCGAPTCTAPGGSWSGTMASYTHTQGGGQRIEVERVPPPLRVNADRAEVAPGEAVTFSLVADGQLNVGMWMFITASGVEWRIPHCGQDHTSCTLSLTVSGWVEMRGAAVDQQYVARAASAPVAVAEASLTLTCPPSVVRGSGMTCTATPTPAGANVELEWQFAGGGHVINAPPETGSSWSGEMAVGGTITVKGKVAGVTVAPVSAPVSVTNRTWAPSFTSKEIPNGSDARLTLSAKVVHAHDLGAVNFFEAPTSGASPPDPVKEISDKGPNHGLYYYNDLALPVFAYYVLNWAAMTAGSNFYNQQDSGSGSGTVLGGTNWCSRGVVTGSLPGLVEAHELEHIRVFQNVFTREVTPLLNTLEVRAGTSFTELLDAYDSVFEQAYAPARSASNAIHDKPGNPYRVTPSDAQGACALKNEDGQELQNAN
jgi:hypothetical protein